MFLNKLTLEQKISFLALANHIAKVDGNFEASEKDMLDYYALEMNIEDDLKKMTEDKKDINSILSSIIIEKAADGIIQKHLGGMAFSIGSLFTGHHLNETDSFNIDACLSTFENSESKRILILEILAIIYSNDDFHIEQRNIMNYILTYFDVSSHLLTVYTEWAKTMISMQKQGNALIHI